MSARGGQAPLSAAPWPSPSRGSREADAIPKRRMTLGATDIDHGVALGFRVACNLARGGGSSPVSREIHRASTVLAPPMRAVLSLEAALQLISSRSKRLHRAPIE
jgi:hypothetical protein